MTSTTLNISINCGPKKVYDFVSNAENLPKWAKTFIRSIKKVKNQWIAETPQGPVGMRIVDKNPHGILDHYVKPPVGGEIYVPMRVIANGKGSEILFTVFQQPGMSDEAYQNDIAMVRQDLENLKRVMEE